MCLCVCVREREEEREYVEEEGVVVPVSIYNASPGIYSPEVM